MCAEQRPGTKAGASMPARVASETLTFAGQRSSDKVLAELGAKRAAWIEPIKGIVVQVAAFDRPAADPRPAIGPIYGTDGACGLWPVELDR